MYLLHVGYLYRYVSDMLTLGCLLAGFICILPLKNVFPVTVKSHMRRLLKGHLDLLIGFFRLSATAVDGLSASTVLWLSTRNFGVDSRRH